MSRSRKKHAITGTTTCRSEKQDKQIANRRLRSRHRDAVNESCELLPMPREISDIWSFGKDGKTDWTGTEYEKKARRK